MKNPWKNQTGFTFIEFVIILVILLLLAYIAFPNILRTYRSENEKSIKLALRAFHTANDAYRKAQIPPGYTASIHELITPKVGPSYLDSSWNTATRHGFTLTYLGGGKDHPDRYSLMAVPILPKQTAKNSYCMDQKGVLISSADTSAPLTGSPEGCAGGTLILG